MLDRLASSHRLAKLPTLQETIDDLQANGVISAACAARAHLIRDIGNDVVHDDLHGVASGLPMIKALLEVLRETTPAERQPSRTTRPESDFT
jgi:hypothetical protein